MKSVRPSNLKIKGRGALLPDYYADVVVFDPDRKSVV